MRKLFSTFIVLTLLAGNLLAASNNVRRPSGNFFTSTETETVLTVSSSAWTSVAAVDKGVYRRIQNTGTSNINMFNVLASSTTAGISYLQSSEKYVEDIYFGVIYFIVPAGSASSTLSVTTFQNQ